MSEADVAAPFEDRASPGPDVAGFQGAIPPLDRAAPLSGTAYSLASLVAVRRALSPDKQAIHDLDTGVSLTWSELYEAAESWARVLLDADVRPGDLVLTMFHNGAESWLSWLSCALVGAVEVPVNPEFRGEWLAHVLDKSQAAIALVDEELVAPWTEVVGDAGRVGRFLVVGRAGATVDLGAVDGRLAIPVEDLNLLASRLPAEPIVPVARDAGEVSNVLWTSGTTGRSKGVVIPWGQWWNRVVEQEWIPRGALGESDRLYAPFPSFHMLGHDSLYRAAVEGSSVVSRQRFSVTTWLSDIRDEGCTWTNLMGTTLQFIANRPVDPDGDANPLRFVVAGPLSVDVEAFAERYSIQVITCYGSSEANLPLVSVPYRVTNQNRSSCGVEELPGQLFLANAEDGPCEVGEIGELWVRDERSSNRMFSGYLNDEAATAAAFVDGWFRTGDLFRKDTDGLYHFTDRLKDAIRRGGENISSAEVEAAILAHPDVADCAVFAVPASSEDEVVAVVIRKPGSDLSYESLQEFVTARVPRFARPGFLEFVDSLPRTPTQKIQKNRLRERGIDTAWKATRHR